MSILYRKTAFIRETLFQIIGKTEVRNFFSYYAISHNGSLFGLFKNDKFYLRMPKEFLNDELCDTLEQLNDPNVGIHSKQFYHLPNDILSAPPRYSHLLKATLAEIKREKERVVETRNTLLRSLLNFNISTERLLKRLGIHSIEEFRKVGAYQVYVEMIKRGIDADQNMLFRLYGAENQLHAYTMTEKQKMEILRDADQALYDSGLRRRFKTR